MTNEVSQLRSALQKSQFDLTEVLDECRFLEQQCDERTRMADFISQQAGRRERSFVDALQSLAQYVQIMEQSVLYPAFGDVLTFVRKYHPLASSRDNAMSSIGQTIQHQSALNTQVGKILSQLRIPNDGSIPSDSRFETFDRVPVQIDDAYTALSQLSKNFDKLASSIQLTSTFTVDMFPDRALPPRDVAMLQKRIEDLTHERDSLKSEMMQSHAQEKHALAARFETILRAVEQAAIEKSILQEEINTLRRSTSLNHDKPDMSIALQHEREEVHRLRLELERLTRENIHKINKLEEDNVMLKAQVARKQSEIDRGVGQVSLPTDVQSIQRLTTANEQLKAEITRLQAVQAVQGAAATTAVPSPHSQENTNAALRAKIANFEMTIHALNTELGALEGRIAELQRQHLEQRRKWIEDLERERQQFHDERMECDLIVKKLTEELEGLIKENKEMKDKLERAGVVVQSPLTSTSQRHISFKR